MHISIWLLWWFITICKMCCCFREYLSAAYQAAYSDQLWSVWSNFKIVAWIQGVNNTESWGKIPQILKLNHRRSKYCSQFLKHSNDSLWTKSSGILVFKAMSSTYCIARSSYGHQHCTWVEFIYGLQSNIFYNKK